MFLLLICGGGGGGVGEGAGILEDWRDKAQCFSKNCELLECVYLLFASWRCDSIYDILILKNAITLDISLAKITK